MNGDLLDRVEEFLAASGMSAGRFGLHACNNARLVERLRAGSRVWPETESKIRDFMAAREGASG